MSRDSWPSLPFEIQTESVYGSEVEDSALPEPDYVSPYPDGLPGHRGTDTEIAAAVKAMQGASETWRKVYEYIDGQGEYGATDCEGQADVCFSFAKRRCDLHKHPMQYVVDSGKRRATPRGALAIVWVTRRFMED